MLRHYRSLRSDEVQMKSLMDPVTVADKEIETALVAMIEERFPDHAILAEEFTDTKSEGKSLWIIDPLDGTNNYLHGLPNFAVSIAYTKDGCTEAAMICSPLLNERYAALRGQGATLNGEPITVSEETSIERSMLCTGFGDLRKTGDKTNLANWSKIAPMVSGIRRYGSAALDLCWVACGRFDGFWERGLSPWDVAAGSLIVQEAGGRVFNIGAPNSPFDTMNGNLVAATPSIASKLHSIVVEGESQEPSVASDASDASDASGQSESCEPSDAKTSIVELRRAMELFIRERDWGKFHNPKNVAMSIAIEAAELLEIFQWKDHDQAKALKDSPEELQHVKEELADILAYVMSLSSFLDIDLASAFLKKMAKNREKYPIKEVFGRWKGA